MALRATTAVEEKSPLAGLSTYWNDHGEKPTMEWKKWLDIFEVAITAKHSISLHELVRATPPAREATLMGGGTEETASRKVISILFLSLGNAARKTITDLQPGMRIAEVDLKDFMKYCEDAFDKKCNRTLDRFRFFSRHQLATESLQQFWSALNGLAATCEFGTQTASLVYDIFILNMKNKAVQERLCTEPKDDPEDGLKFAIAYEEGILRQQSYGGEPPKVKSEPVYNVESSDANNQRNDRKCNNCGMRNFTMQHIKVCRAREENCNNCGKRGHYARCCKQPRKNKPNKRQVRRVNWVEEEDAETSTDENNQVVLHIDDGQDDQPYIMKGTINGGKFKAMIDSGSPVTIFGIDELRKILNVDTLFVRPLAHTENYVDYNKSPLKLMGHIIASVRVGDKQLKRARFFG